MLQFLVSGGSGNQKTMTIAFRMSAENKVKNRIYSAPAVNLPTIRVPAMLV
jgi:hypothetical protein